MSQGAKEKDQSIGTGDVRGGGVGGRPASG